MHLSVSNSWQCSRVAPPMSMIAVNVIQVRVGVLTAMIMLTVVTWSDSGPKLISSLKEYDLFCKYFTESPPSTNSMSNFVRNSLWTGRCLFKYMGQVKYKRDIFLGDKF